MQTLIVGGGNMGLTFAQSFLDAHILRPQHLTILEINEQRQNDLKAKVVKKYIEGDVLLHFNKNDENVLKDVNYQGQMPLPPYIKRNEKNKSDYKDYQTIFAEEDGAVAAPTAGLHFTDELKNILKSKGVLFAPITHFM